MTKLEQVATNYSVQKKQKKVMHVSEKLEVLDRLASGGALSSAGRHFGIEESTIKSVKKEEKPG
jgi:hypothetical protein